MEAKLQALSIAADNAEYELDEAVARQDSIAEESFETPEQEADIQRRHNGLDDQIDQLQGVLDDALALQSEGLDEAERYYGISSPGSDDEEQDEGGEGLSVEDASDIWMSNGMDGDYSFGYSEEDLKRAASGD